MKSLQHTGRVLQPTQAAWQCPHHGMGDPCSAHCIPSAHCLHQEVLLQCKFSSLANHTPGFPPRGAQQRRIVLGGFQRTLVPTMAGNTKSWIPPSTPSCQKHGGTQLSQEVFHCPERDLDIKMGTSKELQDNWLWGSSEHIATAFFIRLSIHHLPIICPFLTVQ